MTGAPLGPAGGVAPVFPPNQVWAPALASPRPPAAVADDRRALADVSWAAIFVLVETIVGLVVLFDPYVSTFFTAASSSTGGSTINLPAFYLFIAAAGAEIALFLVALILYWRAFRTLASSDRQFSTPSTLTFLEIIAAVLIIAVGSYLLDVLVQVALCAPSGGVITSACIAGGPLLIAVGLLVVVAILALVGFIGVLLGIWRLGSRYGETMFKVGAIFLIFPILSFIGSILILLAARSARGRFGGGAPAPPPFG
ncbi:MAG: DUF973 family protein [Thermoplasmata archaeon]